jgi:ATP-dependent Clp protease ATP-binding subunit ClpA
MSKNKYNVNAELLKSIDYKILVISIPEEDVEDLLTKFSSESGKISKSYYDDFLISDFIANINQLMGHIKEITTSLEDININALRKEVVSLIIKYNKLLDPENIIINSNKVLKIRKDKLSDGDIELTKNSYWNKSYYDEEGNYIPNKNKEKHNRPEIKNRDINQMSYDAVPVFWDRLSEYINIKRYNEDDIDYILSLRCFHSTTSFNTYIVQNFVVDVEEIYERVEGMGVNVDPNKIIRELFQLCVSINDTISYKRAKDLQPEGEDDEEENKRPKAFSNRKSSTKNTKKSNLSFKKVPKKKLLELSSNIKNQLIGQDDAVDQITEAIKRASVGLKDPFRPIGTFLLAGKTGTGKTLTSKVLADELIESKNNRVIIDCSEYSSDHEYAKLIGSPQGYIGHDQGGYLTNAVASNPFSVIVFDEVEKASSKVYDLMLQIFDEGRLTDGKGQPVSFKDTIIIMTSNIGVQNIKDISKTIGFGDVSEITEKKKNKAIKDALQSKFKPEFLNRIDSIVYFKDLSDDDYKKIIDIELDKITNNLKLSNTDYKDVELEFDKKIKKYIFENGVDKDFGARPIKRVIQKDIANEIASVLLECEDVEDLKVKVTIKRNKVVAETKYIEDKEMFLHGN